MNLEFKRGLGWRENFGSPWRANEFKALRLEERAHKESEKKRTEG